jgi:hypothetical protein
MDIKISTISDKDELEEEIEEVSAVTRETDNTIIDTLIERTSFKYKKSELSIKSVD